MSISLHTLELITLFAPLLGAAVVGLTCRVISKPMAHSITISSIFIALLSACFIAKAILLDRIVVQDDWLLYTWAQFASIKLDVGFLVDGLTSVMLLVVTSVSLLVHIYSIGYMADDKGYARFFSYMSLFTFAMLSLVLANNFLVLFFGWEGVGLVSYLLIGFWFTKPSAAEGSLKAFLVNRVGDFGFIIAIALVLMTVGSLHYQDVFAAAPTLIGKTIELIPGWQWSLPTVICLTMFIGAMGKSAQIPLHVWLPESMEGPTPISALIHAATMVTAGVYMVARMSPVFELSEVALSTVMIIGSTGALLLGLVGIVQHDIKRVVAYSTMSQLGYMMAANGASAYSLAIFHLTTHAFFKALLFLGAGSVIMGMHHDQDLRHMGGLRKLMPITHAVFLIGTLALVALPPFAGYFSKDAIIEAVALSQAPGAGYAYICLVLGAFVTSLYSFRALFLAFYGEPRMDAKTKEHVHESPKVVLLPLILLAIPSVVIGWLLLEPMVLSARGFFSFGEIAVLPQHDVVSILTKHIHSPVAMAMHAPMGPAFWATLLGLLFAWVFYLKAPYLPKQLSQSCAWGYKILVEKFGFDLLYDAVFVKGTQSLSQIFYQVVDRKVIDDTIVMGPARLVRYCASGLRCLQTGQVTHYAFVMLLGMILLIIWVGFRYFL